MARKIRVKRCDERVLLLYFQNHEESWFNVISCKIIFIRLKFFAGLLRVFILNTRLSNGLSAGFEMTAVWLSSLLSYVTLVVLLLC